MSQKRRKTCIAIDDNYVVERPLARSINELLGPAQKLAIWIEPQVELGESSPIIFEGTPRALGTSFLSSAATEPVPRTTKSYFALQHHHHQQQHPSIESPPLHPSRPPLQSEEAALCTLANQQPFVSWAEGAPAGSEDLASSTLQTRISALQSASLRHSWIRTMSGSGAASNSAPQRSHSPSALGWAQFMSSSFSTFGVLSTSKHIAMTPVNQLTLLQQHHPLQLAGEVGGVGASMPITAYLGRDLSTNERVVIWMQRLPQALASSIRGAVHVMGTTLRQLKEGTANAAMYVPGIPRTLYFDVVKGRYQCLVIPALGPTLMTMVQYCGGTLSERSVLLLGIQLLHVLRHCMTRNVLLNDLSPHTLRFGSSSVDHHVAYVTSFGHCALNGTKGLVRHSSTTSGGSSAQATTAAHSLSSAPTPVVAQPHLMSLEKTLPFRPDAAPPSSQRENSAGGGDHLNSSSRSNTHSMSESASRNESPAMVRTNNLYFSSARYHLGKTLSPADDLEALGFTLAYCLVGSMPWRTLVNDDAENTLIPDTTAPAAIGENGKKIIATPARQLFRMKEQYVLHSQQSTLPRPIRSLLSSTQQLAIASQAASTAAAAHRAPSFASEQNQSASSPPLVGTAAPTSDMLGVLDALIAEFRQYVTTYYGPVEYAFDWDVLAPQRQRQRHTGK